MSRIARPSALLLVLILVLAPILAAPAAAQKWVNQSYPWSFVEHHDAAEMIDDTTDSFVFGTDRGILYFMERDRSTGRLKTQRQREVFAPVRIIRAANINGDHKPELLVTTARGDLFVIDVASLEDVWRTAEDFFQTINSFTVSDVDEDGKPEIVLLADDRLVIMSGDEETEEFRSSEEYIAQQVLVADVDNDGRDEIVLNTGKILDARFRQLEWDFPDGFGPRMDIFDIDGDGNLEIVGLSPTGDLQIVEADTRRVKFE